MCKHYLEALIRARSPKTIRKLTKRLSDHDLIKLVQFINRVLSHEIPLSDEALCFVKENQRKFRHLANPRHSLSSKRRYMIQKGGAGAAIIRSLGKILSKGLSAVKPIVRKAVTTAGKAVIKTLKPTVKWMPQTAAFKAITPTVKPMPAGVWHVGPKRSVGAQLTRTLGLVPEGIISSGVNILMEGSKLPGIKQRVTDPLGRWWQSL